MKIFSTKWLEKFKTLSLSASVGDIKASMLTEAELNDPDWVLMDGRDVTSSKYHILTGNTNVPDSRGQFLRSLDNGAGIDPGRNIGTVQEDATAKKGLSGSGSAASSGNHSHMETTRVDDTNGSSTGIDRTSGSSNSLGSNLIDATHNTRAAGSHTHSVSLTISSTDQETRPKNIAVNYFLKVN